MGLIDGKLLERGVSALERMAAALESIAETGEQTEDLYRGQLGYDPRARQ